MTEARIARRIIIPSGKHRLVFGIRRRVWNVEAQTLNPPPAEPQMDSIWEWNKSVVVEDIPHIS